MTELRDKEAVRQLLLAAVAVPGALWATSCLFLVFIGQNHHDDNENDDDRGNHDKYKENTTCPVLVFTVEDSTFLHCAHSNVFTVEDLTCDDSDRSRLLHKN